MTLEKKIEGFQNVSETFVLRYEITEDYSEELQIFEYGVRATKIYSDNRIISHSVKSVTPNITEAESLLKFLYDHSISPYSLGDIIEDILLY